MNAIDDLEQEDNFFHKGKKPSKEDLEELGIDEDDMDDVYSEGAEEDFDEDESEDESEDEEEDEEETEEENEEDQDEKEMKKSAIESLIQDQSTLEELSIELIKQNKEQAKEIGFLKSKVESSFRRASKSQKTALLQKSSMEEGYSGSEIKKKINEGIKGGELSTSDMLAWEGSRRISPSVKKIYNKGEQIKCQHLAHLKNFSDVEAFRKALGIDSFDGFDDKIEAFNAMLKMYHRYGGDANGAVESFLKVRRRSCRLRVSKNFSV